MTSPALNKGRGNIPPSSVKRVIVIAAALFAQQRKGGYSPFK